MTPTPVPSQTRQSTATLEALGPPGTPLYAGPVVTKVGDDGEGEDWVPLTELACAWSIDYRALLNFVRDHSGIRTERVTTRHLWAAGARSVFIMVRYEHLDLLHARVRQGTGPTGGSAVRRSSSTGQTL